MPLLIVVVPALPKDAVVELHVTAVKDNPSQRTSYEITTNVACGSIECHSVLSADGMSGSLSISLDVPGDNLKVSDVKCVTEEVGATFLKAMKMMDTQLVPQCARVFYKCSHALVHQIVQGMPSLTLSPPICHIKTHLDLFFQYAVGAFYVLRLFQISFTGDLHKYKCWS